MATAAPGRPSSATSRSSNRKTGPKPPAESVSTLFLLRGSPRPPEASSTRRERDDRRVRQGVQAGRWFLGGDACAESGILRESYLNVVSSERCGTLGRIDVE